MPTGGRQRTLILGTLVRRISPVINSCADFCGKGGTEFSEEKRSSPKRLVSEWFHPSPGKRKQSVRTMIERRNRK